MKLKKITELQGDIVNASVIEEEENGTASDLLGGHQTFIEDPVMRDAMVHTLSHEIIS